MNEEGKMMENELSSFIYRSLLFSIWRYSNIGVMKNGENSKSFHEKNLR